MPLTVDLPVGLQPKLMYLRKLMIRIRNGPNVRSPALPTSLQRHFKRRRTQ